MAMRARCGEGLRLRPSCTPLDVLLRAADEIRSVSRAAVVYAHEIYNPNLREPWSIAKRRDELVAVVRGTQKARAARRAHRTATTNSRGDL